eukprot:scaffold30102_cov63-Phaeocystis_antarctica.AAC.2
MFTVPLHASASCAALYASKRSALSTTTTRGSLGCERSILSASERSAGGAASTSCRPEPPGPPDPPGPHGPPDPPGPLPLGDSCRLISSAASSMGGSVLRSS